LNFPPGSEHLYCNTGYDLLAEVVTRASGMRFSRFVKERIFEPAGMKASLFCDDHRMLVPKRAMSYRQRLLSGRFELVHFATERAGPSNLFTTADDMGNWLAYLDRLDREDPDLAADMQRPGKLASGKELDYAAGWRIGSHRGTRKVSHGGSTAGYRATLHRYPEHRFAVAILGNVILNPEPLAHKVVDIYLGKQLEPVPKEAAPTSGKLLAGAKEAGREAESIQLSEKDLESYAGSYYSEELGFLYRVVVREGKLVLLHPNADVRLRPVRKDRFDTAGNEERVFESATFTRGKDGRVAGLKVSTARARNVRFIRVNLKLVP
jgi:hypothetical protein